MSEHISGIAMTTWRLAKTLWDYHHTNHVLGEADCILVLGSNDLRVAERGAELYLRGYAPLLVFSGGLGNFTQGHWNEPEADKFAKIAYRMGVPEDKVLIENKSTNTGENIRHTQRLFAAEGLNPNRFIVVQKPFMERRTLATFKVHWPEKELVVTSPQISMEDYPNDEISPDLLINAMVGDLQRIKIYPEKGFQVYQEIPPAVWSAYLELVRLGYDKHLIVE
ncbi:YdcF family protein [Lunatimonas salinarum]|uniref:YdcF family protein n=1 Tax=Lunatimonas salinarum TaxID=1774590 RepID=UPI001FD8568D|nr:YdcF family protein [Lunatimonas salinarum]